jgi:hypothetical protein
VHLEAATRALMFNQHIGILSSSGRFVTFWLRLSLHCGALHCSKKSISAISPSLLDSAAFHLPKIDWILQKLCGAANSIYKCHIKQSPEDVTAVECGFA